MNLSLILEKAKHAYKSSTIWFNAIAAVALPLIDLVQSPLAAPFIPAPYVLALTILGNIILRFKTTQPLEQK